MFKVVYNKRYGGFTLSDEAIAWMRERGYLGSDYDIPRHHPLLVECVETLGDKASGEFSKLTIRILTKPKYRISEYDGYERVIEYGEDVYEDASKY